MGNPILIEVAESSAVGEVRRAIAALAAELGLDEDAIGRLSVIASELASNLVKHATRGIVLMQRAGDAVEVLALDSGPGIADIAQALRDGHSTTSTSGTGLGAISRMADFFDLYSARAKGTAVLARVGKQGKNSGAADAGAVSVAVRGETVNGDGWVRRGDEDGLVTIMVVDGLGHGTPAHQAAVAASETFRTAKGSPAEKLRTIHDAMKGTRGAAIAIAELNRDGAAMRFAGVGNISATMIDQSARRSAVSVYGIVGHDVRDFREFSYPWSRESLLIMHTDGLTTRWDLDHYPGLLAHDPSLIAGVLWKDHRRQNDDSTVLVARTP